MSDLFVVPSFTSSSLRTFHVKLSMSNVLRHVCEQSYTC